MLSYLSRVMVFFLLTETLLFSVAYGDSLTPSLICSEEFDEQKINLIPEAPKPLDAELQLFISKFKDAVERRDLDYIVSVSADNFKTSTNGDWSKQSLIELLTPNAPDGESIFDSNIETGDEVTNRMWRFHSEVFGDSAERNWNVLEKLIKSERGTIWDDVYSPSLHGHLNDDLFDDFESYFNAVVVIGENTPIYSDDRGEVVLDHVNYEVVWPMFFSDLFLIDADYYPIQRYDGTCGYIERSALWSLTERTPLFIKRSDGWVFYSFYGMES